MATMPLAPTPLHALNGVASVPQPAPAPADVTGTLMTISPQMAADLLKRRLPNRPISKARVRLMIQDLRDNRWVLNGEPIILTEHLDILDGQHRLLACQESGIALTTMVIVGIPPSALPSIDQGAKKSAADQLSMHALPQAQTLAATARWLYRYERGTMRRKATTLRDTQLPAYVQARPSLPTSLPWGRALRDLLPSSCGGMLFHVMTQHDPALAKRYYDALIHGDQLQRDDPPHLVRDRLLKDKSPRTHLGVVSRAALLTLGWNCLRQEKPLPVGGVWKGLQGPEAAFPQVV